MAPRAALFAVLLLVAAVLPTAVRAQSCGSACGSNGCAVGSFSCPSNCADSTSSNINGFRSCVCSECRTMCGSGEYVDGGTYGTCQDCQAGKYGRSEDSHVYGFCTACSSGQYQDTIGSTECHNCPDGTTSSSGADSSSDCTQAIDIKASGAAIVAPVVALGAVVVAAMQ